MCPGVCPGGAQRIDWPLYRNTPGNTRRAPYWKQDERLIGNKTDLLLEIQDGYLIGKQDCSLIGNTRRTPYWKQDERLIGNKTDPLLEIQDGPLIGNTRRVPYWKYKTDRLMENSVNTHFPFFV